MKILAPVSGYKSAVSQIEAGAKEIYLAGDTEVFNNFTFSGRAKYNAIHNKICPDVNELIDIIDYAHRNDVFVMYAANILFLADDPSGASTFEKFFLDYVEQGLKLGVDSIILGDIGAILLLHDKGIKTHITSSSFLETINSSQIQFFKEIGINRIVLSYQSTLDEIIELTNLTDLEIEVFGHFGCSFFDGYCNFKHSFGEHGEIGSHIGVPCQNLYNLYKNNTNYLKGKIFNASLICSICVLPILLKAGVDSVKLVGREFSVEQNAFITKIYTDVINLIEEKGYSKVEELNSLQKLITKSLPQWWKQKLCMKKSCKYSDNPITRSYVGV